VSASFYRTAWIVYLALAVAGLVGLGFEHGAIGRELFLSAETWWIDLALGAGAAALLLAIWTAARRFLPECRELESRITVLLGPLRLDEALALALISGLAEEVFFRGALQGAIGPVAATVVFAALHLGPGRAFRFWSVFALAAGALFCALALERGNLLAPIVAHVTINALQLARLARSPSGTLAGSARGTGGSVEKKEP
jgi:membrane protease YdiL (CAAX protease family)